MVKKVQKKADANCFIGPRRRFGDFTDEELVKCVREIVTRNDLRRRHVAIAILKALNMTPELLVEQLLWTGEPIHNEVPVC